MIRPIMRDILFLTQPSEEASAADYPVVLDLLDTLRAHQADCLGMAANMIGVRKRIIAVSIGMVNVAMINPVIVRKSGPYQTEEGCLSLDGVRTAVRYQEIEVEFRTPEFKKARMRYDGLVAQIIQHEIDHLEGILI